MLERAPPVTRALACCRGLQRTRISRELIGSVEAVDAPQRVLLDMDSTEIPVYGQQEKSAYNGHFDSTCYYPLLRSNRLETGQFQAPPTVARGRARTLTDYRRGERWTRWKKQLERGWSGVYSNAGGRPNWESRDISPPCIWEGRPIYPAPG